MGVLCGCYPVATQTAEISNELRITFESPSNHLRRSFEQPSKKMRLKSAGFSRFNPFGAAKLQNPDELCKQIAQKIVHPAKTSAYHRRKRPIHARKNRRKINFVILCIYTKKELPLPRIAKRTAKMDVKYNAIRKEERFVL